MQENPLRNDRGEIVAGTRESKTRKMNRKSVYYHLCRLLSEVFVAAAIMDTPLVAQKEDYITTSLRGCVPKYTHIYVPMAP